MLDIEYYKYKNPDLKNIKLKNIEKHFFFFAKKEFGKFFYKITKKCNKATINNAHFKVFFSLRKLFLF